MTRRWPTSRGASRSPRARRPPRSADLRAHLSDAEVHDAIAVVGLLNFANRAALATGITAADDLPQS